jgi:hypothetical protein
VCCHVLLSSEDLSAHVTNGFNSVRYQGAFSSSPKDEKQAKIKERGKNTEIRRNEGSIEKDECQRREQFKK